MIENMTTELTMLGTGNATVTKCYNTCFTIKTGKNILLVDAGGPATVYWDSWRKRKSR